MSAIRSLVLLVLSALLVAGCGGNDPDVPGSVATSGAPTAKGNFTAVVSFGDSLSDIGVYAPVTSLAGNGQPPYFGGKFTVNGAGGTVWVENIAASLGVLITPAELGFAGTSVACPAAANSALASSCTGYSEGGSRVTNPNGIGKAEGALTVPMVTQMDRHLARFGGFKASDLVLVYGGNNDVITQFSVFATAAAQIQTQAIAGQLTSNQAQTALFAAQTAAQNEMKKAAQELARYVRTKIVANGGKYVAVMTLSNIVDTPFGNSLPASVRPTLTQLSQVFNLWLRDGLANQPVQIVDMYAIFKEGYANPARYGLVNITGVACDPVKIDTLTAGLVTDGSSLFCNGTVGAPYNGLSSTANAQTWLFADSIHPTPGGHKVISDAVTLQLKAFGWL